MSVAPRQNNVKWTDSVERCI